MNLEILGMNDASDKAILPKHYALQEKPYFKGYGQHSVYELEILCEQFKEFCYQQSIIKVELIKEVLKKQL